MIKKLACLGNPTRSLLITGCFLVLFISGAQSQAIEVGAGIGGLNYAGDLVRGFKFKHIRPGVFGFYKFNFSDVVSTRVSLTFGKVTGDDSDPIDPAADLRDATFSANALEATLTFEYNFLDFKHDKSPIRWSPYLFGGFGFTRFTGVDTNEEFSEIQPVIPIGIGFKHSVGKKFSASFEIGARKTFFDLLDGISGGDVTNKNFQFGNPSDDDWYYFFGISLSYIFYNIPCPFPYIPNQYMMRNKIPRLLANLLVSTCISIIY